MKALSLTASLAVGTLLVCVSAGAAFAKTADPLTPFYTNTLESRHQDGKVFRVFFNRDRSFKVLYAGKVTMQGTYTFKHKVLCMIVKGKVVECPPFRTDLEFGKTWDATTPNGKHDYLTLRRGR